MFKELAPILSKRSLVLTVTALAESGLVRVTVTPRPLGKEDPKALSTPFVVEGTAEELDRELSSTLVGYVGEHLTLDRALASVKATMDAELQVAKDEAAKKVAEAKKSKAPTPAEAKKQSAPVPEPKKPEPPPTMSLFGDPEPQAQAPASTPAAAPAVADAAAGDDDDDEEQSLLLGETEDGTEDDEVAA